MKRYPICNGLLLFGLSIGSGACVDRTILNAVNDESTPSVLTSPEIIASASPVETQEIVAPMTPTDTYIETQQFAPLELDDLTGSLFFGDDNGPCQLPCWNGLVIGKSRQEDVQVIFESLVPPENGSNQFVDFSYRTRDSIDNHTVSTVGWENSEDRMQGFSISAWSKEDTGILWALEFRSSFTLFSQETTPQAVIRNLGKPDYFLLASHGTEGSQAMSYWLIIYNSGFVFSYQAWITEYYIRSDIGEYIMHREFCLDGSNWVENLSTRLVIMEPLIDLDNPDTISPLQQEFVSTVGSHEGASDTSVLLGTNLVPVQEYLGVDLDYIVDLAQGNGEDTCIVKSFDS